MCVLKEMFFFLAVSASGGEDESVAAYLKSRPSTSTSAALPFMQEEDLLEPTGINWLRYDRVRRNVTCTNCAEAEHCGLLGDIAKRDESSTHRAGETPRSSLVGTKTPTATERRSRDWQRWGLQVVHDADANRAAEGAGR